MINYLLLQNVFVLYYLFINSTISYHLVSRHVCYTNYELEMVPPRFAESNLAESRYIVSDNSTYEI